MAVARPQSRIEFHESEVHAHPRPYRAQNRSPTRTQAPVPDSARLLFDSPKVDFTPWAQTSHDPNDTATDSAWYDARIDYGGGDVGLLTEKRAAQLVEDHEATPSVDVLGWPFLSIAHHKDLVGDDEFYATTSVLDIQGNVLEVIDARDNTAESRTYGMLGQSLVVSSEDAGDRWTLLNALGQPMRSWDSRSQRFSFSYDTLRCAGGPDRQRVGRLGEVARAHCVW